MKCDIVYKVAEAFICMREYDLAYNYYKTYIKECDDNFAGAWHGYAITLQHKRMVEDAKNAYKKALTLHLNENTARSYLWGAWSAINLNDYALAYELVKKSLDMDDSYAYSWKTIYIIAKKLNLDNSEEYKKIYEKMVEERPYEKRECEGLKMLFNLKDQWDDELKNVVKTLIKNEKYKDYINLLKYDMHI